MKDGPLRRSLKRVARANYSLNLRVARVLHHRSRYRLAGECRRCARCCEAPGIRVGRLTWYFPTLRRLFLWWQEQVNGFVLTARHHRERLFIFRCTHFDWGSRSCDSYDSRPGVCRDYPRGLLDQPRPEMLAGCGYRPIAPNAAELSSELEARGLPPEQLVQLKKRLFLE